MNRVLAALTLTLLIGGVASDAAAAGRGAARGLLRGLAGKGASSRATNTLRRDLIRDRATRATPLLRPRTFHRYTTRAQALREVRRGIPPGRHLAPAHRGRIPGAGTAAKKYGLPRKPDVRMTVKLPATHPVRSNKALGGQRGVGEITSPRRVPPTAIKKVSPVGPAARASR